MNDTSQFTLVINKYPEKIQNKLSSHKIKKFLKSFLERTKKFQLINANGKGWASDW